MVKIEKDKRLSKIKSHSGNFKKNVKGRPSASDGNVRERILNAAREVFCLYSFKTASTRMIAKQAGVEHPMIHYYFGSKEDLFYAMAEIMYNEVISIQQSWFKGIEASSLEEGFSIFVDRVLDYAMTTPDALRISALNAMSIGNINEIPGYRFMIMNMASMKRVLEEGLMLKGSNREIEMFIYCFYNIMISFIGTRSLQAQALNMDPLEEKYRAWVKDCCMTIFLPWFKKILFGKDFRENK
jgi:TetR/AcrR family transcriptional regulator